MAALLALKNILIGAIPTFILVWLLFLYISHVFLAPLQATLKKRRDATSGLRERAEASIAQAEQKTAEYEAALRAARAEVYRIQEQERQKALEHRAEVVRQAHERAEQAAAAAREQIRGDAEAAQKTLATQADAIASSIADAILKPAGASSRGGRA